MEFNVRILYFTLLSVLLALTSCVSKKKYLEDIAKIEEEKDLQIAQRNVQITNQDAAISDLRLRLANKEGANEALVAMQDRYEGKIKKLEEEKNQMSSSAENQQASMGVTLKKKELEIEAKQKQLDAIKKVLEDEDNRLLQLGDAIQATLKEFDEEAFIIEVKQGKLKVALLEKLLFRKGSVSRLKEDGKKALEKIAAILQEYPSIFVQVIGHTDNRAPEIKSYKDNWNFSVLRAATIVRTLVNENDFSPNQVLAAGKGEFQPKTSNETSEGRATNRRIEMVIGVKQEELVRRLQTQLTKP